jgi:hypothetical protein
MVPQPEVQNEETNTDRKFRSIGSFPRPKNQNATQSEFDGRVRIEDRQDGWNVVDVFENGFATAWWCFPSIAPF